MKRIFKTNTSLEWQVCWELFGFGYDKIYDHDFDIYDNYLIIGPLQFKWYSLK